MGYKLFDVVEPNNENYLYDPNGNITDGRVELIKHLRDIEDAEERKKKNLKKLTKRIKKNKKSRLYRKEDSKKKNNKSTY